VSTDTDHAAVRKLRDAGIGDAAVQTFARQLERVRAGESGVLPEADIEPVGDLPDADDLTDAPAPLDEVVVIKLNGGLGTSMGLSGPKSLLEVKAGRTFLDLIVEQVRHLREQHGARVPLVLMNSFATQAPSLEAIGDLEQDVPRDFLQHKVPKLRAEDLEPAEHPADPDLEWAPPGHGDLYPALVTSGMLARLLERGYRYAFVSNADNLGAVLDPRILAWFADSGAPFAMEVADRTEADRKGGHLARRASDGALVLREVAQTPDEDLDSFQDIGRHRYFNTNTLWVDLRALDTALRAGGGVLELPLIVNRKTVDPKDKASTEVLQLETAMGAAIGVLDGATALRVPRTRFAPVKTTDDLLGLRSDAYVIAGDRSVRLAPERNGRAPVIELDGEHFKLVGDFEQRFAHGAPSLLHSERLQVEGDVRFGAGVVVRGNVRITGPRDVPDRAVLRG
jgi:UTP--glucose-1-phosphate uridylyltransferase